MEANKYSESSSDDTKNENEDEVTAKVGGYEPDKILGATNASGELMFLLKWRNVDDVTIVPAKIANVLYPQVVIEFYENHVGWYS